ncbi:unnamed protein product, partial [Owenia fusiformis]
MTQNITLKIFCSISIIIICSVFIGYYIGRLKSVGSFTSGSYQFWIPSAERTIKNQQIARNINKVIIFTYRRSGSSFFAELFNQNPDVFYMFEPLKAIEDNYDIKDLPLIGPPFLRQIMDCHFHNNTFLSQVKTMKYWNWKQIFRNMNQLEEVQNKCKHAKIVVAKIIRMENIAQIIPYFGKDTAIIFLTRDPRAILNSRNHENDKYMKMSLDKKRQDMLSVCQNTLMNINIIQNLNTA